MPVGPRHTSKLYELFTRTPWERKVWLCSSFSQGRLMLERIAKEHGPIANVEVKTVEALVMDAAALPLAKQGLKLISDDTLLWVVHGLLAKLAPLFPSLLDVESLSPGTIRVFHRAVVELRRHGVQSSELEPIHFENGDKGLLLQRLLAEVEADLGSKRLVDIAGAIPVATEQLATARLPYSHVIRLDDVQLDGLFAKFMDKLTTVVERVDVVSGSADDSSHLEHAQLFGAAGTVAQCREVLRRVLAAGVPLDEVEIVTSSSDEEIMAIHTQAARFGLPVTYGQGLPGVMSRNGQLAALLLDWMASNYEASHLLVALREGLLRVKDTDSPGYMLAHCLEEANIGWGSARYIPLLQKFAESQDASAPHYQALLTLMEDLFRRLPIEAFSCSVDEILTGLHAILKAYGSRQDDEELSVIEQVDGLAESARLGSAPAMSMQMAIEYTRDVLAQIRISVSSRPEPGAIHVSTWTNGGLAGRQLTFVTGLSEHNWSVSAAQDPILLDVEKSHIGHGLLLSEERAKQLLKDRQRAFQAAGGDLVLSYCAYDVVENKSVPPASVLLEAYRASSGNADADYSQLMKALGQPIGYARVAMADEPRLDAIDIWMTHIVDTQGNLRDGRDAVLAAYPALHDGYVAELARASDALTEFDGLVGSTAEGESDRVEVAEQGSAPSSSPPFRISPSGLETLAACPRKYFYQYGLRLRPEETTEFNRDEWLNPLERGSLYHEVFQRYMALITEDGQHAPNHNETLLLQVCNQVIAEYQGAIPAPSPHIQDLEANQIRASMGKFLAIETSRPGMPRYFELPIGSREEPFPVDLGDGVVLPLSAVIDRVDEVGPSMYHILDYKTGKSNRYRESKPFKAGQQLQHAVYAVALEQWLAEQGIDKSARVTHSAYVFPSLKAGETEVGYAQNQDMREKLRSIVSRLLAVIDKGVFPATPDTKACEWCDFLAICTKQASIDAKDKRENAANDTLLAEILEVERYA